ncbi:DUF998 domain-containing protein [Microterricola viridarii]|uniref:DUF998 domain-containing protein n=1 Tax=Microterricola viridarii TaxID=412690 RepID=A0A120I164_9MICO|nr:DUF998 domain-containing protein [Microterricola viridarii]AMB59464.1 hypothetical protein AWU67_12010 [Microterricola viridarii]
MSQSLSIVRVLRHPAESRESLESVALMVGAAGFVLGTLVAVVAFREGAVPIAGPGSLGQLIAVCAALVALAVVVWARMLVRPRRAAADGAPRLRWFDTAAIALTYAMIALLGWVGVAAVLAQSFVDAVVFPFSAALLAGVAVALTAYVVFLSAVHLTPVSLSLVLALFLVVGMLTSMLSATDPHWWQANLSSLGMTDDLSARAFNLTLIIAGALVTTIANFATASLPAGSDDERRHRLFVRVALMLIGILLACVGIFPVDESLQLHNLSATGMAIVFVTLVLRLRTLIPTTPRVFLIVGYVFVGVIVLLAVLFVTGYYNLTAVELVLAVLVFTWLIVFMRNQGLSTQAPPPADEARAAPTTTGVA